MSKDAETIAKVEEIVHLAVARRLRDFGASMSSCEIEQSASGKTSVKVKVYNENPVDAANMARYIRRNVLQRLGMGGNDDTRPILEPSMDEMGRIPPIEETADKIMKKGLSGAAPVDDDDVPDPEPPAHVKTPKAETKVDSGW